MRKQIYTAIATLALIGLFGALSAKAQTSNGIELRADIPFEFTVGKVTLPAGEYTVKCATRQAADVLELRNRDGHARALVLMNSVVGKKDKDARLIFNRYGNRYFFAQAWMPSAEIGLKAPKSRAERAIQRELAGVKPQRQEVALTASIK